MSDPRVWEGVVVNEGSFSRPKYAIDEGMTRPGHHTWGDDSCWLRGLVGKRVRLTVEILSELPAIDAETLRKITPLDDNNQPMVFAGIGATGMALFHPAGEPDMQSTVAIKIPLRNEKLNRERAADQAVRLLRGTGAPPEKL